MQGASAHNINYAFSQTWLPTVQEVLQADWQDAGHSPQPPVLSDFTIVFLVTVVILFAIIDSSLSSCLLSILSVFQKERKSFNRFYLSYRWSLPFSS